MRRDLPAHLYAIQFPNGSIKIGYTINLRRRLIELCPISLKPKVVALIENTPTAREDERLLHFIFRDKCLGNERFKIDASEVHEAFEQLEILKFHIIVPQGFTLLGYRRRKLREYGLKYWVSGIVEEVAERGRTQRGYGVSL